MIDTRRATIDRILATSQSIAVVGFSSKRWRAGYYVPAYLHEQGYRIFPVNPFIEEGLGLRASPSLLSLEKTVDLVLLFRQPERIPPFVGEAITIGAKAVWMQLGITNAEAARRAQEAGLDVVQDACMMVEHRRWRAPR